jgi:hypothetical protein
VARRSVCHSFDDIKGNIGMKRRGFISTLLVGVVASGILLGLLYDPSDSRPPAAPPAERLEARPADASPFEGKLTESPQAWAGRKTLALEPGLLSAKPGFISGVVVDPSEEPIEGALCQIMKGSSPMGLGALVFRPAPPSDLVASIRTDSSGVFRLRVPPGFWTLSIDADGWSPWEEGSLQPGDFRWVRLAPTRNVTVLVRDEAGNGIARARVRLMKGEFGDPRASPLMELTNGAGAARLSSIPKGTWYFHVSHEDFVGRVEPLPPDQSGSLTIEMRLDRGIRIVGTVSLGSEGQVPPQPAHVFFDAPGSRSSHDVECDPDGRYASRVAFPLESSLEVAAMAPGLGESRKSVGLGESPGEQVVNFVLDSLERIAIGRVEDTEGRALEGVEVYLKPIALLPPETLIEFLPGRDNPKIWDFDPKESMQSEFRPATSTDAGGRFRVDRLDAERPYKLLLVSERHSNATLWVEKGEPGSIADLGTVRLGRTGLIWGYVRRPDGTPIEGTEVRTCTWTNYNIVIAGPTYFQTKRPEVQRVALDSFTNEDGYFSIEPFPEGEFHLMCLGTLFGPYSVPLDGPIEIVTEDVERRDPSRRISVVLTVLDDARAPVPKPYAQMRRLHPESNEPAVFSFNDWINWSWDLGDDSGRIELDASDEGTYRIEVRDIYGQLADQSLVIELTKSGLSREVVLSPAHDPSAALSGVVQTMQGEPMAGVKVALVPDTGDISCNCLNLDVRTDASGAFTFGLFMKGNHRLVVTDPEGSFPTAYYFPARPGDPIVVTME